VEFSGWYVFIPDGIDTHAAAREFLPNIYLFKKRAGSKSPGMSAGYRHTLITCQTKKFIIFGFFSEDHKTGIFHAFRQGDYPENKREINV